MKIIYFCVIFIINYQTAIKDMIYKENDRVEVGFSEDIQATYMILKKELLDKDLIDCHQEIIEMLETRRYTTGKHLVDTSALSVISTEVQEWIAENVIRRIQTIGKLDKARIALVLSRNAFAEFGVKMIAQQTNEFSVQQFFHSKEEAEDWLKELDTVPA